MIYIRIKNPFANFLLSCFLLQAFLNSNMHRMLQRNAETDLLELLDLFVGPNHKWAKVIKSVNIAYACLLFFIYSSTPQQIPKNWFVGSVATYEKLNFYLTISLFMSTLNFLAIKISFSAAVIVLIYGTRRTGLLPSGLMKCHSRNKQINKI